MDFLNECNKCGKCKQLCPSYKIFLNESFSPRGRISLIKAFEKEVGSEKSLKKRIFSCLLCGTCENSCPLNLNISTFIYETRAKMKKNTLLYLFKYFSLYPGLFCSILQNLSHFKFFLKIMKLSYLKKFSNLNIKFKKSNHLQVYSKLKSSGRIAIFSGCTANYLIPSITNSLIYVLNWLDYEVIVPKQHCCGAPLLSAGFKNEAIKLAQKNIKIYKSFNIDGVVTLCPTCSHFIENIYEKIIGEKISILKVYELFEKSQKKLNYPISDFKEHKIGFHASCHSSNYVKDVDKVLELLKRLGINDLQIKSGCCGSAGVFSFLFKKESMDILRKKVLEYKKMDMIVSSCPNCIIQFKSAIEDKKILHYIELIHKILLEGEKNARKFFKL
ncbi:MAG: (Fe-S)-binding protein [Thermodesulfovibrio sp.]|nr:(Fe-S)-binding protein [Thermodesulfovibrio sp.]MDW7972645.1 (Fe-S)-binding protein [Thermodesulfovibrio sp.]